jgi:zinc transporter 9
MAVHTRGFVPVAAALAGNFIVTCLKTVVAITSGSSAMFSEAIHSAADTSNQLLLLIGVRRSGKKPDREFGYGYGYERFFWALLSACGIFFVGAGVTFYHGIHSLLNPVSIELTAAVGAVLVVSFIIELGTLIIALQHLASAFPHHSWRYRFVAADPSTLAVCLEDAVAVLGVLIAGAAITASYLTGTIIWDAIASMTIGALLAVVAIVLIIKNRSYLIGRSIPDDERKEITAFLESEPTIERVLDFKSTVLDIDVYRVKCEIEFNGPALFLEAFQQEQLRDEYEEVKGDYEAFKRFCVDYADRIPRLMGKKIDVIEERLKAEFPEVRYIDMEIN